MDALPIPNHPDAWSETGASHCCGHNAQLTGVVGAAMALADPEVAAAMGGNLCFMAVPAEEYVDVEYRVGLMKEGKLRYGGGKCELIRVGAFDDVDIALGHHSMPGMDLSLIHIYTREPAADAAGSLFRERGGTRRGPPQKAQS